MIKNSMKETGNTGEPEKELSELEKKLLHFTGEVVVEGIIGIPEIGVENKTEVAIAVEKEKTEEERKKEQKHNKKLKLNEMDYEILRAINTNLEKLVKLKEQELNLARIKLQMKYNVELADENLNDENFEG